MKPPCFRCGRLFCPSVIRDVPCPHYVNHVLHKVDQAKRAVRAENERRAAAALCTCHQEGWPHPACPDHGEMI